MIFKVIAPQMSSCNWGSVDAREDPLARAGAGLQVLLFRGPSGTHQTAFSGSWGALAPHFQIFSYLY